MTERRQSGRRELRSALYEGTVVHRRSDPEHAFTYRVAMPLLFLDELESADAVHPLVRLRDPGQGQQGWPAAVRFRRRDFLGPSHLPLDAAVHRAVGSPGAEAGPVALLGHLRTFGWLFNPLTVYYCFDAAGAAVCSAVLEVTNTPWHERQVYVVGPPGSHHLDKALHVSPFLPMDCVYELTYGPPGQTCSFDFVVRRGARTGAGSDLPGPPLLRASMRLRRRPLTRDSLNRLLLRHPVMPAQVSWRIYRQALRLKRKGAAFHPHPPSLTNPRPIAPRQGVGHRLRSRDAGPLPTLETGEPHE